jgi:hypothetical protein
MKHGAELLLELLLQNGLPLPSSDEKDKLGRWRNTKASIVQISKHIPYSVRAVCITNL